MYIFEFTHVLNRDDSKDIWQNLMPRIAMTAEKDEVSISHPIGFNNGEFFHQYQPGKLPTDLKWMVYKIKKKAEIDYEAVTADSSNVFKAKTGLDVKMNLQNRSYSYNWPYDFFSLVELAKMDVELGRVENITGGKGPPTDLLQVAAKTVKKAEKISNKDLSKDLENVDDVGNQADMAPPNPPGGDQGGSCVSHDPRWRRGREGIPLR